MLYKKFSLSKEQETVIETSKVKILSKMYPTFENVPPSIYNVFLNDTLQNMKNIENYRKSEVAIAIYEYFHKLQSPPLNPEKYFISHK